jgi:hypothetical protein
MNWEDFEVDIYKKVLEWLLYQVRSFTKSRKHNQIVCIWSLKSFKLAVDLALHKRYKNPIPIKPMLLSKDLLQRLFFDAP